MRTYEFVVKDQRGKNFRGALNGEDEQSVHNKLQRHGYLVLSIKEKKVSGQIMLPQRIRINEVAIFTRSFATVVRAGLPIIPSLLALEEQTENESLKKIIATVRMDIEFGSDMAASLAKFPHVFSHFYVSLVHSGEVGGQMAKILQTLADYLDKEIELRNKIRSAFVYPIFVLCMAAVGWSVIVFVLIPKFQKIYDSLKADLPVMTQAVVKMSDFVRQDWWAIPIGAVVLFLGWTQARKIPEVRSRISKIKFNAPGVGKIVQRVAHSRFTRTLGSMLSNGVPLMESLEIADHVVNEPVMSREIRNIVKSVHAGGSLSEPMRQSEVFPSMVYYLVGAGEKSGNLPEMLIRCADALDMETEHLIRRLLNMLEPALTVGLTFVIGFLVVATYAPVYELLGNIGQ